MRTETQMGNWLTGLPHAPKLDLPRTYISQMRKQTPLEPRVHTGVNVDPGPHLIPLVTQLQLSLSMLHCVSHGSNPQVYISCL